MCFMIKGHFSDWKKCTKEEALKAAEHFFRDFPDEQTNKEIFENHIKGISYEQWRNYSARISKAL